MSRWFNHLHKLVARPWRLEREPVRPGFGPIFAGRTGNRAFPSQSQEQPVKHEHLLRALGVLTDHPAEPDADTGTPAPTSFDGGVRGSQLPQQDPAVEHQKLIGQLLAPRGRL